MKLSNDSFLWGVEKRITEKLCALTPSFIGTKALTYLSLCSSLLMLLSYYLSVETRYFLFIASFFLVMQWMFDCLDGAIGRSRKEGFVRWGFYMDHLFDYFFMACIIFGFLFLFPALILQIMILLFLSGSFMVSFFLLYSSVKDKEPALAVSFGRFSPIEFRLLIITLNTLFYFFPSAADSFLQKYLVYINISLFLLLVVMIRLSQGKLHRYDKAENGVLPLELKHKIVRY